ncbi:MAG: glycosyltransferase family 2 protein [Alphaproteobacteria bacterium]|nr:glycosyltransferase family 2 protein [Alphaproteobacteria bacterium]
MYIAVVIPCYKVEKKILEVLLNIPDTVTSIFCVDDACPNQSGDLIKKEIKDKRVIVLQHNKNQGVGGAMITGYKAALEKGADIIVKIDGDGQMNPKLIPTFTKMIERGECDYTKGNRFYYIEDVKTMPTIRLIGNAILSFMTKLSSGYWHLFDPTNGYTAISANVLKNIPLEKLDKRYFFETDILFRLNLLRAKINDVPMRAIYEDEKSNLKILEIVFPFLGKHIRNIIKRIIYSYYLRDFSVASVELLLAIPLFIFGLFFGISKWIESNTYGIEASAGTVMLSALPILIGTQLLLSFLNYDINNTPKDSIHSKLEQK